MVNVGIYIPYMDAMGYSRVIYPGPSRTWDPPKMVSRTHTIPMGVVWVPLTIFGGPMSLGVPENPMDITFLEARHRSMNLPSLKLTAFSHLKMDGWKMKFLLVFRCYVSFRECMNFHFPPCLLEMIHSNSLRDFVKKPSENQENKEQRTTCLNLCFACDK